MPLQSYTSFSPSIHVLHDYIRNLSECSFERDLLQLKRAPTRVSPTHSFSSDGDRHARRRGRRPGLGWAVGPWSSASEREGEASSQGDQLASQLTIGTTRAVVVMQPALKCAHAAQRQQKKKKKKKKHNS
eukprot:CAMPEP_0171568552 /NCGR_PEP_ID=MMETSP0961-20121227/1831_1 /TAXON_ID=87120 /ORGANISM="Aurantiochytrium limacinum, Strain ATCCMYA-1381" /LENGTH=129 /DNA_ID=CAMNT_0012122701 /DNA_START=880 /DNA_END=1265 /DNA_ORIENTATION=-